MSACIFHLEGKGGHHLPSSFRKFRVLLSKLNVHALQFLCVVKWGDEINVCRAGWTCTENRDVFSPSSDEWNKSVTFVGVKICARLCPALLGQPAQPLGSSVVQQIRKSSEQFIVYSKSVFCSVEADCSSGQFQVLTAGPRSPSSPPFPFWNERGKAWMHIEQWS